MLTSPQEEEAPLTTENPGVEITDMETDSNSAGIFK